MSDESLNTYLDAAGNSLNDSQKKMLSGIYTIIEKIAPHADDAFSLACSAIGFKYCCQLSAAKDVTIACTLLPFYAYFSKNKPAIAKHTSAEVAKLLNGAAKMSAFDHLHLNNSKEAEKNINHMRKLLLSIVDNSEIVVIKMIERLSTLNALKYFNDQRLESTAQQVLSVYAPLANRLGIGQLKWQLEDMSFRFVNPTAYKKISSAINQKRAERDEYINHAKQQLITLLANHGLQPVEVSGRAKHIYSIHRKLDSKKLKFEQIYDANAFRIIFDDINSCYAALSYIHETWPHLESEFDDYIAKPKKNGYQSIHTIVVGPLQKNLEIQIRTQKMHQHAELGVAAHWQYKETDNDVKDMEYQQKIHLLRKVVKWQEDIDPQQKNLYDTLFKDRIYIFTPSNDIIDLIKGATALDAAYRIHTEIGHHCCGAKINGRQVTLTTALQNGDVVDIQTQASAKPSLDWINPDKHYLKEKSALQKVRLYFTHQAQAEQLAHGKALWQQALKSKRVTKEDLALILKKTPYKSDTSLLIALGCGHISLHAMMRKLSCDPQNQPTSAKPHSKRLNAEKASKNAILISGFDHLMWQIARCCLAIPGDPITGYLTKSNGVSVHRSNCKNIKQAKSLRPARIIDVAWTNVEPLEFAVELEIKASERPYLIRDITTLFSQSKTMLLEVSNHVDKDKKFCYLQLTLSIKSTTILDTLCDALKSIPGVQTVSRKGSEKP